MKHNLCLLVVDQNADYDFMMMTDEWGTANKERHALVQHVHTYTTENNGFKDFQIRLFEHTNRIPNSSA